MRTKPSVGKSDRNRTLDRRRHRWENDTKMDSKYITYVGVDCSHLAQDNIPEGAVVNTEMNNLGA